MITSNNHINIPLCVDLDGTLLKTDTLYELFFRMLKKNPLCIFILPFLFFKGRAKLKSFLTAHFIDYIDNLPVNEEILNFAKAQKSIGRKIYLVTATNESLAKKIARKLDVFDDVFGSNETCNLKSSKKAEFLVGKFGVNGFDYIGNDRSDLKIWKESNKVLAINVSARVSSLIKSEFASKKEITFFKSDKVSIKSILRLFRIHQWAKNILIFVPLILAHRYFVSHDVFFALIAFFSFGFGASSTYIFNDLLDLESDRIHRVKKYRPIASGKISIQLAVFFSVVLMTLSLSLCTLLPVEFLITLLIYILTTLAYSLYFKKIILLDVIILALLYTIRMYAGAVAITSEISFWLLTFSIFIFLSLAFLKRFIEFLEVAKVEKISGRGYTKSDREIVMSMGVSSGFISLLTYIMYINEAAKNHYENPNMLILGSLPLLYFICRIWMRATHGKVHSDPIFSAIKDKVNYLLGLFLLLLFILAKPI